MQGEKNNGFDVLYHNMKYGLVASKELAEFFRERYFKSSIFKYQIIMGCMIFTFTWEDLARIKTAYIVFISFLLIYSSFIAFIICPLHSSPKQESCICKTRHEVNKHAPTSGGERKGAVVWSPVGQLRPFTATHREFTCLVWTVS